ncbi:hypothetical protein R1sor_012202 [Riccia sorocarpa]|uniref:Galactokinase n=1 Tax=Riccia sorocarpa TaxID=122646 RepID=A0ABD3I7A4_9MARC
MASDSDSPWPSSSLLQRVKQKVSHLTRASKDDVKVVISPYRICPLGAHIDHQGGSVTAMAINRGVVLGFVASDDITFKLESSQFLGTTQFSLEKPRIRPPGAAVGELELSAWGDYARGAAFALKSRGYEVKKGIQGYLEAPPGFDGGGLSSSAAVGVAYLLALEYVNDLQLSKEENVELDRIIENEYLGLKIGVLDQSAILFSKQHCLSLIHCKTLEYEIIPPHQSDVESFRILIAFSGLRYALSSKPGYNLRVKECEDAARVLLKLVGRERSEPLLSSVTPEEYSLFKGELDGNLAKRAKHFFTEVARVSAGVEEWSRGDMEAFGKLMSESGQSSIDNYECGCEPLIQLRRILLDAPGVFGARFSGAGFRGCCVALVASEKAEEAAAFVDRVYKLAQPELVKHITDTPVAVICQSARGAHLI